MKDSENKIRGLYAVADNTFTPNKSHVELAATFLIGGCKLIQLRIKRSDLKLWDQEAFDVAVEIMKLKKKYNFTFIVNDFVDVASEVGADGVHVGANDLSVTEIKKRINPKLIVGYSSHSIEEALFAEQSGADYVAFGAIYPTKMKGPSHPVQGAKKLKDLVSQLKVPVVAIGGINRSNIDEVWSTGAASVAMITGLTLAKNISQETEWYVNKLSIRV